jgi:hypothetical protein
MALHSMLLVNIISSSALTTVSNFENIVSSIHLFSSNI